MARKVATLGSPHQLAGVENSVAGHSAVCSAGSWSLCVLVLVDNTTAVSSLKNQGGTRSRSLSKLTRRILLLASSLQITIVPRHITCQLNVLADLASRVDQVVPSEWALSSEAFNWVIGQSPWGPPEVVLFANAN